MTFPSSSDDYEILRKRWLNRYLKVQAQADQELKAALIRSAENAQELILSLASNSSFSSRVKSAQLRLLMQELRHILKEIFNVEEEVIKKGHKNAAGAAFDAFTETDRRFLSAAFSESARSSGSDVESYIQSQRIQALLGVNHAISRITKTDRPLSARVYNSRSLANRWVQRDVNTLLLRNASAKEIANTVRKHIRPNTPGGVSYAAMRLARTEINNAFHATSVDLAQDRPWVQNMKWNLSKTHDFETKCLCETYEGQKFALNSVPAKPHPQCRCFVTPVLMDYSVFLNNLTSGMYEDWIRDAA